MLIEFARHRSLDVVGAVVLGGTVCGVILGLVTHSSRALLLEGSVVTGTFGLAALTSLRARRPLMFHFALASMGGRTQSRAGSLIAVTTVSLGSSAIFGS